MSWNRALRFCSRRFPTNSTTQSHRVTENARWNPALGDGSLISRFSYLSLELCLCVPVLRDLVESQGARSPREAGPPSCAICHWIQAVRSCT